MLHACNQISTSIVQYITISGEKPHRLHFLWHTESPYDFLTYATPRGLYCSASARCCDWMLSTPARSAIVRPSFSTR